MTNITVIVPYYTPDQLSRDLVKRCVASVDKRFDLIEMPDVEHLGPGITRNDGLRKALNRREHKPDYITFLDADDTFAPDAYDQMVKAIEEMPNAPIIQMNHIRVMPDGSQKPRLWNKKGTYTLDRLPQLWVSSVNKLYKTSLVEDIRFNPGLNHGEDELFVLECLAKARTIYNTDRVALHYHKDNPNSLSKSTTLDDIIAEQVALLEFLDDHRDDKEICEAIRIRQSELWINPTYKRAIGGTK